MIKNGIIQRSCPSFWSKILSLGRAERTRQQLIRAWAFLVINLKRSAKEALRLLARVIRDRRACISAATDFEDRLKLRAVGMWVAAREHLNNEASQTPDICFSSIGSLADDFW